MSRFRQALPLQLASLGGGAVGAAAGAALGHSHHKKLKREGKHYDDSKDPRLTGAVKGFGAGSLLGAAAIIRRRPDLALDRDTVGVVGSSLPESFKRKNWIVPAAALAGAAAGAAKEHRKAKAAVKRMKERGDGGHPPPNPTHAAFHGALSGAGGGAALGLGVQGVRYGKAYHHGSLGKMASVGSEAWKKLRPRKLKYYASHPTVRGAAFGSLYGVTGLAKPSAELGPLTEKEERSFKRKKVLSNAVKGAVMGGLVMKGMSHVRRGHAAQEATMHRDVIKNLTDPENAAAFETHVRPRIEQTHQGVKKFFGGKKKTAQRHMMFTSALVNSIPSIIEETQ